jgi:butyrate kinase
MAGYLGTKDLRVAWDRARKGDEYAHLILRSLAYQIAKDIGAMAAVCEGRVDAVALTGGMAHSPSLVELIRERVSFIAPILMYPGEAEMDALAAGALRVLRGEEAAAVYVDPKSA